MTIITNAFSTFSAVGNNEDLKQRITNIAPTDAPFISAIGKAKATNRFHEWLRDTLAAAAANAQLEGDAITGAASTAATRLSNSCQIMYKAMAVTGSQSASDSAGRSREFVYQTLKRSRELRRDQEFACLNNQTPVPTSHPSNPGGGTASTSTAAALRPLNAWLTSNDDRGSGGSDGSSSAAATDGTQRALEEQFLKRAVRRAWNSGGEPDLILAGGSNKQNISAFAGNATRQIMANDRRLIAGIGYYESDFGVHKVVPDRFSRDRDVWVLDTSLFAWATFRDLQTYDLGRTGDADQGYVLLEGTLESLDESGSAIIADLSTDA